jgi:hypothetical protein
MNKETFNKVVNQLNELGDQIVGAKRPDYTRESDDVLQNFKESAREAGITPMQAWLVHFHKQYSAIARFVKNPECTPSEPIPQRFADLRNYLQLGYGIYREHYKISEENKVRTDSALLQPVIPVDSPLEVTRCPVCLIAFKTNEGHICNRFVNQTTNIQG